LVSGEWQGVLPTLARTGLSVLTIPYGGVVRLRNLAYDTGLFPSRRVEAPVISVGNLTVGGTGKTPFVAWLAEWLQREGRRPAIVSRGYHARGESNDEARQLAQQLKDVPQIQQGYRVASAKQAVSEFHADVIVMDDGMQHRRLARDLNIVLIDGLSPFGYGRLLPRGLLREPVRSLRRADVVLCTRADLITPEARDAIRTQVNRLAPQASYCEVAFRPHRLLDSAGNVAALETLRGQRIAAFCGVGNPAGFRELLAAQGIEPALWRSFPDHHHYTASELLDVSRAAAAAGATMLVCTHKDLVKLCDFHCELPLAAITLSTEFRSGQATIENRLKGVLR
jgi:tetraacyldisaccharide 4'-kinase